MRLETLVEVVRADACNDNGEQKQEDGKNSKGSQRLASGLVVLLAVGIGHVHSDELEQEVGQSDKIDEDDDNHSSDRLATNPPSGQEEEEKGDDQGSGGKGELNRLCVLDDDKELDREGEEEEEIELEEGNVNLVELALLDYEEYVSYLIC